MVAVPVVVVGLLLVLATVSSSVRTVVLPRGVTSRLGRFVFITLRLLFRLRIRRSSTYEVRDRVLAFYAPIALLLLLVAWMTGILVGYTAIYWGLGVHPVRAAFTLSGSAITTLGIASPHGLPQTTFVFTEAGLGLIELALLITFLPNTYADFHRRELLVTKLRGEASQPPEGVNILIRLHRLERLEARTDIWIRWIDWFSDVEDTHSAFPALAFFRSPIPEYSWTTASGAVLDGAALAASCLDLPRDLEAELCIRAGYLCLRRIAEVFRLPFDARPLATDPIAVTRAEFDEAWERMHAAGVPLRADQDRAWRDFAGWRVNYDEPLIRLATMTEAPLAPWSSDRGVVLGRKPTFVERIRL